MSAVEKRVGFGPRLGAYLIDGIVIGVVYYILAMILTGVLVNMIVGNVESLDPGQDLESAMASMAALAVAGVAAMMTIYGLAGTLYFVLLEGMMGASVGKMALGLKIASADGNGKGGLMKRAIIKASPYVLMFVIGILVFITKSIGLMTIMYVAAGLANLFVIISMFMALRESKQALYDSMSDTAVFKKADVGNVSDNV